MKKIHLFNKIMAIVLWLSIPATIVLGMMADVISGIGYHMFCFTYVFPISTFLIGLLMLYWGRE
jgi:hypothetical protein